MKRIGIMTDIETLGLGPKSIVTQWAFVAFDLDDPETIIREVHEFLPLQPQLVLGRQWSASTLIFWLTDPTVTPEARELFKNSDGNDLDELLAIVRSVSRKFEQTISGCDEYEIWARGPQFDIVNLESLLEDCGEPVPWHYQRIMDLRTTMKLAGVSSKDVDNTGFIPHIALDDCKFQIACYSETMRQMRSQGNVHANLPETANQAMANADDANA